MSTTAKLSARQRIEALLDENSFVEIGAGVTARSTDFNLNKKDTPADGVITGYGVIDGNLVYVYSQDSSVLGGSIGEMHAKKIVRMYQMARKMGAPVVALIDCSGIRVEESTDALNCIRRNLQRAGHEFRSSCFNRSNFWTVWRWSFYSCSIIRFYIYGRGRKIIC